MWKLTIEDDEGKQTGLPLAHEEYALGRAEANSIRLTDRNVSRQHATLCKNGAGWVIRDLDSYNGTYVNGVRVNGEQHLRHGDLVQLGDYRIELIDESLTSAVTNPTPAPGGRPASNSPLHTRPNRLVMVVGPTPGAEFPLEGERFTIGRSEDATISINHSSVSRLHAELISLGNGRYEVVDKQSANGVRINGVELKRGLLEAGDAIELGDVRLRFVGAGKIFRAGPDGVTNPAPNPGSSTYESVAPSVRPPSTSASMGTARGKMLVVVVAAGLLIVGAVLAMSRRSPDPGPKSPDIVPTRSQADADMRVLAEAQELLKTNDVEGAHKKLHEITDTSPAREDPSFKDIEQKWAEEIFHRVDQSSIQSEKRRLLEQLTQTESVPLAQRRKAVEMLEQLAPEPPPRAPEPDVPQPSSPTGVTQPPQHAAPAGGAITKTGDSSPPPPSYDPSSYPAQRKRLEPRVWSGRATVEEIKLLHAICNHQGDASCRDRARQMLSKMP